MKAITTITTGLPYVDHHTTYTTSTSMLSTSWGIIKSFTAKFDMLCSRPILIHGESITIRVYYYTRVGGSALPTSALIGLQSQLSAALGAPVILQWVRLSQPYMDATVLAEYLSNELQTQSFRRVMGKLIGSVAPVNPSTSKFLPLPSTLVGLKVNLAGRLIAERTKPRITRNSITVGSLSSSSTTMNTSASYTATNYKGSYTVKVWLCNTR